MRSGFVRNIGDRLFPITPVFVEGPTGRYKVVHAVIDTGFTEEMALPADDLLDLGLEIVDSVIMGFANGLTERVDVYSAAIFWEGEMRLVDVHQTGTRPLIGMNLLRSSRLCLNAVDLGEIDINAIASD